MTSNKLEIQSGDSYNGARHDNFSWSQSISDLDVIVKISCDLKCLNDLKIHVSTRRIKVEACVRCSRTGDVNTEEWNIILQGELSFEIKSAETIWTFLPGFYIHIHMEKLRERWWDCLITSEPKISLDKIDCSRRIDELTPEEEMTLQELMWGEHKNMLKRNEKVKEQ